MATANRSAEFLQLCRQMYKCYVAYVHHNNWIAGKAASFLCDTVESFINKKTGHAYDILIISWPPQHGKSMTVTETLPSWYLINNPTKRVIEISYSEDFAQLFGRRNKAKLNEFGGKFGVELATSPNSSTEFETTQGGSMISRGVMSGVTGRPCDLMIIDDPIKNRAEADSEAYRNRLWAEWLDSFKSRLAAGAKVILIQTRWHEDDLAGRIMATEKNVTVVNLPCEAREDDPLGRKPGDALCPEIGKDNEWLKEFKASYDEGSRTWEALYQGHPTTPEGNILNRKWWKRFDLDELPPVNRIVISVDAAFKDGESSDYTAITVWGKLGPDIYLIDMVHKQIDFVRTVDEIQMLADKYPSYKKIYIEEKANGAAIISFLKRKLHSIININPMGGKVSRVNAISGLIEAGNVHIPNTDWGESFINECASFPNAAHDDMVDSMSQCLMREYYKHDYGKTPKIRRRSIFEQFGVGTHRDALGKDIKVRAF